jgi:hypothetical protein
MHRDSSDSCDALIYTEQSEFWIDSHVDNTTCLLTTYTTTHLDEMHSCLQIYEIVGMICVNLDGGSDVCPCLCQSESGRRSRSSKQPGLKAFATLARTCRTLHGPSIDYLWRCNTLGNLVWLIPSDLWTEEVLDKGHARRVLASSPDRYLLAATETSTHPILGPNSQILESNPGPRYRLRSNIFPALCPVTISRLFKQFASRRKLPFKQVFNLNMFNGTGR